MTLTIIFIHMETLTIVTYDITVNTFIHRKNLYRNLKNINAYLSQNDEIYNSILYYKRDL